MYAERAFQSGRARRVGVKCIVSARSSKTTATNQVLPSTVTSKTRTPLSPPLPCKFFPSANLPYSVVIVTESNSRANTANLSENSSSNQEGEWWCRRSRIKWQCLVFFFSFVLSLRDYVHIDWQSPSILLVERIDGGRLGTTLTMPSALHAFLIVIIQPVHFSTRHYRSDDSSNYGEPW